MSMSNAFIAAAKYNKCFRDANATRKRYRVLKGGAGSGKSVNIAQDFICKLSDPSFKGANLLVVRKVAESNRHSTFAELTKAIYRRFDKYAKSYWVIPEGSNCNLYLKCRITGNEIMFAGCNDANAVEKMKSVTFANGNLTWVWVEESSEITENDLNILDDRLRGISDNPNLFYQITLTFNPVKCWIKGRFFDNSDGEAFISESTYRDNKFIDEGYYKRMESRRERDPAGFKIYGENQWGELEGLIFTNWEIKEFDAATITDRAYGQDFGYTHANAILDIGFSVDDIYVCSEIYEFEKDMADIIQIANDRGLDRRRRMWCDSAEPDRIRMWVKAGYNAVAVSKEQGSVQAQIEWLKGIAGKDKIIKRKIYIHPSCVNTIKEIQAYQRRKDNKTNTFLEEPLDVFDDAMAALRYGIEGKRKNCAWGW